MVTFRESEPASSWLRSTQGSKPQPGLCELKSLNMETSSPFLQSLPTWMHSQLPPVGFLREKPSCAIGMKLLGN